MKPLRSLEESNRVLEDAKQKFEEEIDEAERDFAEARRVYRDEARSVYRHKAKRTRIDDKDPKFWNQYVDAIIKARDVLEEARCVYEEEDKLRKIDDENRRKYADGQIEYWRQVEESDGFDLENVSVPPGTIGLNPFYLERYGAKCPAAVLTMRYARFGLHSYNMSHGTKFELHHIIKFNQTMNCQSTYYFTLAASDPAATSSLVTLQIAVAEGDRSTCSLYLRCFIARLKGAPREASSEGTLYLGPMNDFKFPFWPSDFNDSQRFSEVNESEFHGTDNWIRLFLELVLCTNDRGMEEEADLSKLQILKVATEAIKTSDTPNEVTASNVYITFKGLALARVGELGEHVERKVIVRRNFNERTRCTTLLGEYGFYAGEVAEKRFISRPNEYAVTFAGCSSSDGIFSLPIR